MTRTRQPSRGSDDPRAIASREAIARAIVDLVERGDGAIPSMGEIALEAGMSRQAVYLHYANSSEVLDEGLGWLLSLDPHPVDRTAYDARQTDPPESLISLLAHLERHRAFYSSLLKHSGAGPTVLTRHLRRYFEVDDIDDVMRVYQLDADGQTTHDVIEFYVGGLVAVLTGWLMEPDGEQDHLAVARRIWRVLQLATTLRPLA